MELKKTVAESLIARVIADKTAKVGIKAFVNTCRNASVKDLLSLLDYIHSGKLCLLDAYVDKNGFWHFITP